MALYDFRKDLIHEDIESAVSHMQSVVELARVVRDRKTLPIKVPGRSLDSLTLASTVGKALETLT